MSADDKGQADFISNLRQVRESKGMSAEALADRCTLSRSTIANIETGRTGEITVSKLIALASGLGVHPAVLDPRVDPVNGARLLAALGFAKAAQDCLEALVSE